MSLANRTIDLASKQVLVAADGTAAAPSITNDGDTNTGMFFPAADTIAFSEGGVESMRIDSSGNVGIGTTSPSDILHVSKANGVSIFESTGISSVGIRLRTNSTDRWQIGCPSASADLAIYTGAAATERLRIDSSGNVGIGTTNPQSIVNIVKTSAGNTTIGLALKNNSLSTNTAVGIEFNPNQSDEAAERSAKIVAINTGNGATNPTALTFWTNEAGTNSTERLRIDSSGNVGIGTTSPAYKFDIDSGAVSGDIFRVKSSTWNSAGLSIQIGTDASTAISSIAAAPLIFRTTNTERLRITSGGEVCVGKTSSGAKLHIYNSGSTDARVTYFEKASGTTDGLYLVCYAGVTTHFQILGNGNCQNANNSYGAVSDEKIKQDIVDASTQWNDVKNLRVRKFRFKSDPSMPLQIGLVAQEVELVSPHLVEETKDTDRDGNDLGTTTKGVKYSVLYMKAVKALQEAMERIEQLETNNTALESRIAALEAA